MPRIIDKRIAVFSPPFVGGAWAHTVFRGMGLHVYTKGQAHTPCDEADPGRMNSCELFYGIVRHPFAWLRSFWACGVRTAWDVINPPYPDPFLPLSDLRDDTFAGFIDNYLARQPGYVSRLFERYTAFSDGSHEVVVLRQEDHPETLVRICQDAGITDKHRVIHMTKPQNVTPPEYRKMAACSMDAYYALCDVDSGMLARYLYAQEAACR